MAKPIPKDNIPFTPPNSKKELSLQEVCDILDSCIQQYIDNKDMIYYGVLLTENGLYTSKLEYWNREYPNSIHPRINFLKELQLARYNDILVSPKAKDYNATQLVWFGKTKLGLMEEFNKQKLENEQKGLELHEKEISIGFDKEDEE